MKKILLVFVFSITTLLACGGVNCGCNNKTCGMGTNSQSGCGIKNEKCSGGCTYKEKSKFKETKCLKKSKKYSCNKMKELDIKDINNTITVDESLTLIEVTEDCENKYVDNSSTTPNCGTNITEMEKMIENMSTPEKYKEKCSSCFVDRTKNKKGCGSLIDN